MSLNKTSSLVLPLQLVAALLAMGAQPANAGPKEDGFAAYARGDFAAAQRLLRPLAEDGNPDAQMAVGFMYHDGQGAPRSDVYAYVWFYLAASNFDPGSQDFLDAFAARDLTAHAMTSADIERGNEMAHQCQAQHYKNCY